MAKPKERAKPAKPAQQQEFPAQNPGRLPKEPPAERPAPEDIRRRIEVAAYFRAKSRGFAPGYELEDWLQAEAEVKRRAQP